MCDIHVRVIVELVRDRHVVIIQEEEGFCFDV